jgi:hypothetical protein
MNKQSNRTTAHSRRVDARSILRFTAAVIVSSAFIAPGIAGADNQLGSNGPTPSTRAVTITKGSARAHAAYLYVTKIVKPLLRIQTTFAPDSGVPSGQIYAYTFEICGHGSQYRMNLEVSYTPHHKTGPVLRRFTDHATDTKSSEAKMCQPVRWRGPIVQKGRLRVCARAETYNSYWSDAACKAIEVY